MLTLRAVGTTQDANRARDVATAFPLGREIVEYARKPMSPLETFLSSYIATALWSSLDDDGQPLNQRFTEADLPPETRARMEADCAAFLAVHGTLVAGRERLAGYHFWLTRCGHGAGFFDGDWAEHGDALTDASHAFGDCDLYLGDDGKLYLT